MQNKINQKVPIAKMDELIAAVKESGGGGKLYRHNITIYNTIRQYTCHVTYISSKGKYNTYADFSNDIPPDAYLPCYGNPTNGATIITLYNEEYVGISAICVDGTILNVDDLSNFEDNVVEL